MHKVIEIHDINKDSWDGLVAKSQVATWFQTREAYSFFESLSFLDAFALAVESSGQLKGVVVGYVQKDGGKLKRFFSRRAIILGGPLLSDDIAEDELRALLSCLKDRMKKKAIYVETRNFNDYSRWKRVFEECGFGYEPHYDILVDCNDRDKVIANFKENRKRQIKKAVNEGVVIEEAINEDEVRSFYGILKQLYESKVKQPLFPVDFFVAFFYLEHAKYLLVKYNEKVIGGIMCPMLGRDTIYEWFVCGCDASFKKQYPSVMATWAAIDYAVKHGFRKFDFMGAGSPGKSYGVREFKEKFGGELVDYGRFNCVCKPLLFRIGQLGIKIMKKL